VQRRSLEKRIGEVHKRLMKAREELAVAEEQLQVLAEAAEEARTKALVADAALADQQWREARRHAEAMARAREVSSRRVTDLEREQDELLARLAV
jgi:hypothetical protein